MFFHVPYERLSSSLKAGMGEATGQVGEAGLGRAAPTAGGPAFSED